MDYSPFTCFGLWGFSLQMFFQDVSKLATVGDIEISTKEFARFYKRNKLYFTKFGKNLSVQEAKSLNYFRVLERLINRSLLDQLVKDLEISVIRFY